MPVNTLTRHASFKIGPVVLETLVKHYFDKLKSDVREGKSITKLRQDELLYDEAFNIVKAFLEAASYHTVEEVQGFANIRTPSPPWVHVVREIVPMSCCDEAAAHLIKAFGGEEAARRVVGGVKWWQVRGVKGVDAQWITSKKDWQEAERRSKMQEKPNGNADIPSPPRSPEPSPEPLAATGMYEEDMDKMRCILYAHGGGYYFGSVDQERYSIQRHARKINGRVFAINYRLAPQYPFPCALQDLIAAYIYLIRPPPTALHRPVKPAHIVIAGDSAGGGISLALLQVIRDTGLPMPAGGVLISPWCDLTHSFPSIHTNTATDVIPEHGLSLQKPSTLWPPPSDEMTSHVHASLRSRIRQALHMDENGPTSPTLSEPQISTSSAGHMPVDVGATTSLPPLGSEDNQRISLITESGETLTINQQVHFYTQNSLIAHPLISSALSYLGGLPPLLVIASDKEVLRDEIIYAAHKAANPQNFPLRDEVRAMYPPLAGIESRHKATQVHLQVYDDTAHVLPVLFSFTTPGKYCYRAIATFCKQVTGMVLNPQSSVPNTFSNPSLTPRSPPLQDLKKAASIGSILRSHSATVSQVPTSNSSTSVTTVQSTDAENSPPKFPPKPSPRTSLRRSISVNLTRARHAIRRRSTSITKDASVNAAAVRDPVAPQPNRGNSDHSSDVAGPRFRHTTSSSTPPSPGARTAGDGIVYSETLEFRSWKNTMIRERVSTQGVIRPLEPESELDAFTVPPQILGVLSELSVKRYLSGKAKFDKKFAGTIKTIEKHRSQNLERSRKDTIRNMRVLQTFLSQDEKATRKDRLKKGIKEGLMASSGSWSWAWALDGDERPPPSSIVSRRDTGEARRLARIADQSVLQEENLWSGNNLWSVLVNFLTVNPDKDKDAHASTHQEGTRSTPERRKSRFSCFMPKELLLADNVEVRV